MLIYNILKQTTNNIYKLPIIYTIFKAHIVILDIDCIVYFTYNIRIQYLKVHIANITY